MGEELRVPPRGEVYGICRQCGSPLDVGAVIIGGQVVEAPVCTDPACPIRLHDWS